MLLAQISACGQDVDTLTEGSNENKRKETESVKDTETTEKKQENKNSASNDEFPPLSDEEMEELNTSLQEIETELLFTHIFDYDRVDWESEYQHEYEEQPVKETGAYYGVFKDGDYQRCVFFYYPEQLQKILGLSETPSTKNTYWFDLVMIGACENNIIDVGVDTLQEMKKLYYYITQSTYVQDLPDRYVLPE